jgi:hypothetical protein
MAWSQTGSEHEGVEEALSGLPVELARCLEISVGGVVRMLCFAYAFLTPFLYCSSLSPL